MPIEYEEGLKKTDKIDESVLVGLIGYENKDRRREADKVLEESELSWYEGLKNDLKEATVYVKEFKDKERKHPIDKSVVDENKKHRDQARRRLEESGVRIGVFKEKSGGKKVREAYEVLFENKKVKSKMTVEEAQSILSDMNIDVEKIHKETAETDSPKKETNSLEQLILDNEENYNQIFLNTRRDHNNGYQDDTERFHSRYLLSLAGYDSESLDALDDRVKKDLQNGDTKSLNELFLIAQREYIRQVLGNETFNGLLARRREISALLGEKLNANTEIQKLLKFIVAKGIGVSEDRGWNEEQQTRLTETLKSLLLGEGVMKEARKDKYSREIKVEEREDQMLLRGAVIEVVSGAGLGMDADNLYGRVRETFLARKGISVGVLRAEDEVKVKTEIRARLELHQASLFWNQMKDDQNPAADKYEAMKNGLARMPLMSEETYQWLMEEGRDASYIYLDAKTGEKKTVECKDLRSEMDVVLQRIYEHVVAKDKNVGGDVWQVVNYDQRVNLFAKLYTAKEKGEEVEDKEEAKKHESLRKIIKNENLHIMALQLAEAECWAAMRPGSYHPARRLAYLSDFRMERLKKNLSVPGGYRLVQEYMDSHGGRAPFHEIRGKDGKVERVIDDFGVFDAEGVSLARLGLDMHKSLGSAAANGEYLKNLKDLYDSKEKDAPVVKASQFNMRTDLSLAANVYDAIDALGKPPVGLDVLGKLKSALYPWYGQRFGSDTLMPGVSNLMFTYTKTYLWTNSVANNFKNLDTSKLVDMNKFVEETYIPLVDAYDTINNTGDYVGIAEINKTILNNGVRDHEAVGVPTEWRGSVYVDNLPISGMTSLEGKIRYGARENNITERDQINELNNWFYSLVFNKCYPILESARTDDSPRAGMERIFGWTQGFGLTKRERVIPRYLLRRDRNNPLLVKIAESSSGYKEVVKARLVNLVSDETKWWNKFKPSHIAQRL